MNRKELGKYIGVTGYSFGQVEKDYFQHIILGALSRKMSGILVFKGGTALQKIGMIPRFSEDLDFNLTGETTLTSLRVTVRKSIETYNYTAEIDREMDDERTLGLRIKIRGPLYHNRRGICAIRIEASKREEVFNKPETRQINPPYSDILPYILNIMEMNEIASEKVRTVFTRNKARDLYDLYMLLETGITIDKELVNNKLSYYGKRFTKKEFRDRCKYIGKSWNTELDSLLEVVPPRNEVMKKLNNIKVV